jgi:hypothetical protein
MGVWAVTLALTLMLAGVNILLAFSIEPIHRLLQDARPGIRLPEFALFVMQARSIWIILSFIPPSMAVFTVLFARDDRRALFTLSVLMMFIFIQASLTTMALFDAIFSFPQSGLVPQTGIGTSALYDALSALLSGDGSALDAYFRWTIAILALAVSVFFFWRFITEKDRREFRVRYSLPARGMKPRPGPIQKSGRFPGRTKISRQLVDFLVA